tara:strand:- start:1639 stop:1815 length:177 start_codon:yes stop_codon:yes gene_type:complete
MFFQDLGKIYLEPNCSKQVTEPVRVHSHEIRLLSFKRMFRPETQQFHTECKTKIREPI